MPLPNAVSDSYGEIKLVDVEYALENIDRSSYFTQVLCFRTTIPNQTDAYTQLGPQNISETVFEEATWKIEGKENMDFKVCGKMPIISLTFFTGFRLSANAVREKTWSRKATLEKTVPMLAPPYSRTEFTVKFYKASICGLPFQGQLIKRKRDGTTEKLGQVTGEYSGVSVSGLVQDIETLARWDETSEMWIETENKVCTPTLKLKAPVRPATESREIKQLKEQICSLEHKLSQLTKAKQKQTVVPQKELNSWKYSLFKDFVEINLVNLLCYVIVFALPFCSFHFLVFPKIVAFILSVVCLILGLALEVQDICKTKTPGHRWLELALFVTITFVFAFFLFLIFPDSPLFWFFIDSFLQIFGY